MTLAEKIWSGKTVAVRVAPNPHGIPETKFTIDVRTAYGVRGFRATPEGKKPTGSHKIRSRADVEDWAAGLIEQ